MAKSRKPWVIAFLFVASALRAEDTLITIQSTVITSEIQAARVVGTMQLSIVNATDARLSNVQLELANPINGLLDEGKVKVGTVDVDATSPRVVEFKLDKAFFESGDPLLIRVTYSDVAGNEHEATVTTSRTNGGGL